MAQAKDEPTERNDTSSSFSALALPSHLILIPEAPILRAGFLLLPLPPLLLPLHSDRSDSTDPTQTAPKNSNWNWQGHAYENVHNGSILFVVVERELRAQRVVDVVFSETRRGIV